MKRKKLAVSLVGVILVSCSASTGPSTGPSQEELEDARAYLQTVRAAMEAYEEVHGSLNELHDPSGQEAMSAIERLAQALKSLEATAADFSTALSPASQDWGVSGSVMISQNAKAVRAAWAQARPEFEAWILRGKSASRANEVLRSFDQSYSALDVSMGYAENEVDRLLCEGSGNEWHADEGRCA